MSIASIGLAAMAALTLVVAPLVALVAAAVVLVTSTGELVAD